MYILQSVCLCRATCKWTRVYGVEYKRFTAVLNAVGEFAEIAQINHSYSSMGRKLSLEYYYLYVKHFHGHTVKYIHRDILIYLRGIIIVVLHAIHVHTTQSLLCRKLFILPHHVKLDDFNSCCTLGIIKFLAFIAKHCTSMISVSSQCHGKLQLVYIDIMRNTCINMMDCMSPQPCTCSVLGFFIKWFIQSVRFLK